MILLVMMTTIMRTWILTVKLIHYLVILHLLGRIPKAKSVSKNQSQMTNSSLDHFVLVPIYQIITEAVIQIHSSAKLLEFHHSTSFDSKCLLKPVQNCIKNHIKLKEVKIIMTEIQKFQIPMSFAIDINFVSNVDLSIWV